MKPTEEELEGALTRELLHTYRFLNANHFRSALRPPLLQLVDSKAFWARWIPEPRGIEVSRRLIREQRWVVVVEVLKHEMAHQFVHEVLGEHEEAPHGPAFRQVCQRLGIDATSAGLPTTTAVDARTAGIVARVEKLLALAGSDNRNEAENAAAAAQKLLLKHNLSTPEPAEGARHYGFRQLGRITGRAQEWERRMGNLLADHFFVDVIWVPAFRTLDAKRGHVLEAVGSEANLQLAEYVHGFVERTAHRLWDSHRKTQGIRGNRDRRTYLAGVVSGFSEKLDAQAAEHQAAGLVWLPEAQRDRYVRQRHPHIRTVRHQGARHGDAFDQGKQAGRGIVLNRGLRQGSSGQTRLLRG